MYVERRIIRFNERTKILSVHWHGTRAPRQHWMRIKSLTQCIATHTLYQLWKTNTKANACHRNYLGAFELTNKHSNIQHVVKRSWSSPNTSLPSFDPRPLRRKSPRSHWTKFAPRAGSVSSWHQGSPIIPIQHPPCLMVAPEGFLVHVKHSPPSATCRIDDGFFRTTTRDG